MELNARAAATSVGLIPRWRIADDELFLDGNARQNLATFVTTWMEPLLLDDITTSRQFLEARPAHMPPPAASAPFDH